MVTKIGKQAKSELIYPKDVHRFAADAGLGAAVARVRIRASAGRLLEKIPGIDKLHPISESVASLITERCKDHAARFSK